MKYQDQVERASKADRVESIPLPLNIYGSLLMRPPVVMKFDWEPRPPGAGP